MKNSIKIYKDKLLLFPLIELSWQKSDKILKLKLGILKWSLSISFNF